MKTKFRRCCFLVIAFFLFPTLAQAHSAGGAVNGWHDGFLHPLSGWDHLLAMLAVGFWAAQQRGRAVWLVPLTFVGVMCLGGLIGAAGINLPGVELAIALSVVVFVALAARGTRVRLSTGAAVVGFFAFFHGFAHGAEMPGTVSFLSFGLGFVFATILLHVIGLLTARGIAVACACLVGSTVVAQEATNTPAVSTNAVRLSDVVIQGRDDSMIGIAGSATQGTVGATEIAERPIMRNGEILETIPGVIITQHAGGGKANQYFLRGFNLDHGTDIAIDLDGMPLNLPSHAHGPGYSDMNIVIPELIERVNYEKGPYYAGNGDFSSAGAVHMEFAKTLPSALALVEAGMYGYERFVFADSPKLGDGHLLYAVEAYHDDGPWLRPDDYQRFNTQLTYSQGDEARGFSVTARGYHGKWNSSDQVADSAVSSGVIPLFGTLNPTDGGNSQRYSLQAEWHRADAESTTKIVVYGFYYDLDLFSDFTYFLNDPVNGDQFEQQDRRFVAGINASHTLHNHWWDHDVENTFGLQIRNDAIDNGLYQTADRERIFKNGLSPTVRQDRIFETSAGLYFENKIQWGDKFRSVAGVRGDIFNFNVTDYNPLDTSTVNSANSGNRVTGTASPKLSLIFGPWAQTEFYLNGGFGYHSDDARGTTATVQPDGVTPTSPLNGLFQTKGAEIGVRSLAVPHLQSTFSLWYLYSESELLYEGDTGQTVNTPQPSNRYGIEWANYYSPFKWLTLDVDYANSVARFTRPDDDGGTHVPEAIQQVLSAGITLHEMRGFTASLRLRYFGPRDLISTSAVKSPETILLNLGLGYQFNKTWSVNADIFNLLDRRDHDIDYYYTSRVTPAAAPQTQVHFHPVEPVQARLAVTARF